MASEGEVNSSASDEEKILEAIRSREYSVKYMAPKNISKRIAPDGRTVYVIDVWGNSDCGCEIKVAGYTFTGWVSDDGGEWECDKEDFDFEDELYDALDKIDKGGIHDEPFQDVFVRFYELANDCSCDEIYDTESDESIPIDIADVKSPKECGDESVEFDGKVYHLVGEDDSGECDDESEHCMYAIADDAVADDEGVYSCVSITFEDDDGERGAPIGVEESDETFDGIRDDA